LPPELLLLAQICTKSFVGWGLPQIPLGGAYSTPHPSWFRGGPPGEREEGGMEGGERRGWSPGMPKFRVGKPKCA